MYGDVIDLNARHYLVVRELASQGMSKAAIAETMCFSYATLHRKFANDESLRAAYESGKKKDIQEFSNMYRKHGLNGSVNHADRYLSMQHGIKFNNQQGTSTGGTIVFRVESPFSVVQREVIEGETINDDLCAIDDDNE